MPTPCICLALIPSVKQLAVELRRQENEGGHLRDCPRFKPTVEAKICIGCSYPIMSGCEMYYDKPMPSGFGIVRFFTHLDCVKDGKTQERAAFYFVHPITRKD